MRIRCINRDFRDLKAKPKVMRRVGDEWEGTPERVAEINSAGYGVMAEAVPDARRAPERAPEAPEPANAAGRAAGSVTAPQSVEELEAMTNRELVELCIIEGVETEGRPRKAELVALLAEHFGME